MSSNWQAATINTKPISKMLCYYTNSTRQMQIIRVTNSEDLNLEKIVFHQQRILFEATAEGLLEIYTSQAGKKRIAQIIPCQNLQVDRVDRQETAIETFTLQKNKSA
ncbi:MAG: DUF1830 domain-containing protein [Xenococcaceae cyanobacterium MO_188.B29]|nr:DUF1830 domain-containing protein [Xenococcaceae cyanobacterium MO_188.B29]